jgi:hypothetical protein
MAAGERTFGSRSLAAAMPPPLAALIVVIILVVIVLVVIVLVAVPTLPMVPVFVIASPISSLFDPFA